MFHAYNINKDIWQVRLLSDMDSRAAWACWHVDLNNAAVQWGWTVETRPKPSFQISLTWQVSTRVRGVEIQSLVQYWIKTVCCRSKDHFHWTAPLYPCIPLVPKVGGGHWPPGCAAHAKCLETEQLKAHYGAASSYGFIRRFGLKTDLLITENDGPNRRDKKCNTGNDGTNNTIRYSVFNVQYKKLTCIASFVHHNRGRKGPEISEWRRK